MPTVTDELKRLYEEDFYAWTRAQARALRQLARSRPNVPVDWKHLVEEVEDLGRSELHTVRSLLETIIEHLLKLTFSPAVDPRRGWRSTVLRARHDLQRRLTPTLRRRLTRELPRLYADARAVAALALEEYGEHEAAARLPERCLWSLAEILDADFWPEPIDAPRTG